MRAALFGYLDEDSDAMGSLTETAIFSQWLHSDYIEKIFYARWKKGEVDLVAIDPREQKVQWCVEVKWSNRIVNASDDLQGLIAFVSKNNMTTEQLVTTRTTHAKKNINGVNIRFTPSSEHVYTPGKNILFYKAARGVNA